MKKYKFDTLHYGFLSEKWSIILLMFLYWHPTFFSVIFHYFVRIVIFDSISESISYRFLY